MGNGIGKLNLCLAGDAGEISRRRHDIAVTLSDPFDEGLGHSFCYIRPDSSCKTFSSSSDESSGQTPAFRTISGASISANTSTPLSTALIDLGPYSSNCTVDKASAFASSQFFSSIPLQPIPRNSVSSVRSGPIPGVPGWGSGPIERGFMSGPIERSFISGPLDNQYDQLQRYKPRSKKWALLRNIKKVLSDSLRGQREANWVDKINESGTVSGNSSSGSNNLSSQASLTDDDENESFGSQNVQWAQGKAGEDRVHIVISEEHGWVFVGIYDGFNGPDATDFLVNNLYSNVFKELKGLLWNEKSDSSEILMNCESCLNFEEDTLDQSQAFDQSKKRDSFKGCKHQNGNDRQKPDADRNSREKVNNLGADGVAVINHADVLKALSEALKKTEASYLQIADMMVIENPELALMGSCILVMLMKGEDVYLMNVGDSRAVLAQKAESDRWTGKTRKDLERINEDSWNGSYTFNSDDFASLHNLSSCQLTRDHSTSVKEEVQKIKSQHPDDPSAIMNDRVKGSLKVTRAFGAGFLKQPKWNDALLEVFRIDYIGNSPYITCFPSLCHHRLGPRDRFLVLSSDGLYQYFTNEEAVCEVEMFMSAFPEGDPAQHLVEEVLFRAAKKAGMDFHQLLDIPQGDRRRYHDDVSIIIISFEGRIWRSSV